MEWALWDTMVSLSDGGGNGGDLRFGGRPCKLPAVALDDLFCCFKKHRCPAAALCSSGKGVSWIKGHNEPTLCTVA